MAFWNRKPDPFTTAVAEMLIEQRAIRRDVSLIRRTMADNNLTFADVQSEITKLVNSNTASNNAISSQLKEVSELLVDFNKRAQQGDTPSQADFQTAIAQLQAARSMVEQNTAEVQASTSAIQEADPAPASSTSSSDSSSTGSTDSTGPANVGGTDSNTGGMSTGNAGSSSQTGGALEPGTGEANQTGNTTE